MCSHLQTELTLITGEIYLMCMTRSTRSVFQIVRRENEMNDNGFDEGGVSMRNW